MRLLMVLLCMGVGAVFAADKTSTVGGVTVKVLGQSGKIQITMKDDKTITVEMDSMKERSEAGDEVGKSGSTKHSFNTFASQDFVFKPTEDNVDYHGVKAQRIEFSATNIAEGATLTVPILIFKEDGNFTVGNTNYTVSEGNVKFNVRLENWKFCGTTGVTCNKGNTDEVGAFIEFVISVKGSGTAKDAPASESRPGLKVYDLGDNQRLFMATEVSKDDKWEDMRAGYPKFEISGAKQSFFFAIPKFTTKAEYDPHFSEEEGQKDPSSSVRTCVTVATILSALMAAILLV